jgi:hypothetical protein
MSYRYDERQLGLQAGDIKGAVLLYGARSGAPRFAQVPRSGRSAPAEDDSRGWPFGIGDKR